MLKMLVVTRGLYHKTFYGRNRFRNVPSLFEIVKNFLFTLTNTLAFDVTELITAVKSFMIQVPGDVIFTQLACTLNKIIFTYIGSS